MVIEHIKGLFFQTPSLSLSLSLPQRLLEHIHNIIMSVRIAAAEEPSKPWVVSEEEEDVKEKAAASVVVREYDEERDKAEVEALERLCEVGQRGKPTLVTDLLGDPICRVRHFPLHIMLVSLSLSLSHPSIFPPAYILPPVLR